MIVTNGKSRCQVKNIDGVDYCMNVRTASGYMKMKDVYSRIISNCKHADNNYLSLQGGSGGDGYKGDLYQIQALTHYTNVT